MAVKQFLLLTLAFYSVSGELNCALPWKGRINSEQEFLELSEIDQATYIFKNICPTPIGNTGRSFVNNVAKILDAVGVNSGFKAQEGEFCCYDMNGNVACCDLKHFLIMISLSVFPILMLLMPCFILCCCYSCCNRRSLRGKVLNVPAPNYVFAEAHPSTLPSYHYHPASTGSAPLIPNEYPPSYQK